MQILIVGIGGFLGACTRYLLTMLFQQLGFIFPLGTLISNLIAALLVGSIIGIELQFHLLPINLRLFLVTGVLGGLSTFSTFSLETVCYFENGDNLLALANIFLNLCLSLLFVFIGLTCIRMLAKAS